MTTNELLKADLLDILFDNRNKYYGAYVLRREYNYRLGIALSSALAIVFLGIFLIGLINPTTNQILVKRVVELEGYVPPKVDKPKPPEPPKAARPPAAVKPPAQQQFTNTVIRPDDIVKTDVPDQSDLNNKMISNKTIDGPADDGKPKVIDPGEGKFTQGTATVPAVKEPELVQREPEFPGGMAAWINFLNHNLRVPDELSAGEKKTVLIKFQVAADGAVTGFDIVRSGGSMYDNEVIRVLKRMPKWRPAIQNGVPTPRTFTQPVTFMGLEE